jgi:hypothetical protein
MGCGEEVVGAELPARPRGAGAHRRGGGATADDVVVEIGAGWDADGGARAASPRRRRAARRRARSRHAARARAPSSAATRASRSSRRRAGVRLRGGEPRRGRPLVVVGNLPYQISSALVLALVDAGARGASRARS